MEEKTPGGSRILRHEARPENEIPPLSNGDPVLIQGVHEHLDRCFGEDGIVFDEVLSPLIHLDVYSVLDRERGVRRLVTSGMAERPMAMPDGFEDSPFAELTIALPPGWPMEHERWEDERVYWPVRLLKRLARIPHEYDTFLWHGHTVPNGEPPNPYADGTDLCCALIAPPIEAPEAFQALELPDGRLVRFLAVVPIHADELALKLTRGTNALYDRFGDAGVTDVVDPVRPSVAPSPPRRRRFFGR